MKVIDDSMCHNKFLTCNQTIGFIVLEDKDTGKSKEVKGKATKRPRSRKKTLLKQRYVFMKEVRKTQIYKDYFDAYSDTEKRLLGLEDLVCCFLCKFLIDFSRGGGS